MASNTVYYRDEKEKADLITSIKSFEFSDFLSMPDSLFILVTGLQGTGKTHLACTLSDTMPVFLLGTELREKLVLRKFKGRSKFPIYYKPILSYQEIVIAMKAITTRFKDQKGAIIIDSGSDFQQFAENQYKDWAKVEKVWPQVLWSRIWDMCDSIIYDIRRSGFTLVMTARMKEEYAGDKPTGLMVPRIYNRVPYNADLILELDPLGKEKKIRVIKPLEYFAGETGALTKDMSLSQIIQKVHI